MIITFFKGAVGSFLMRRYITKSVNMLTKWLQNNTLREPIVLAIFAAKKSAKPQQNIAKTPRKIAVVILLKSIFIHLNNCEFCTGRDIAVTL
jgi:hypothetical protein